MIIPLKNETETTEIGAKVASCLQGGEVIYLKRVSLVQEKQH